MSEKIDVNGFGTVLKLLRIANNLSVKELSEKINVSTAYICEVEANRKKPSLGIIEKYSNAFEIGRYKLLYLDDFGRTVNYDYRELLFAILQELLKK